MAYCRCYLHLQGSGHLLFSLVPPPVGISIRVSTLMTEPQQEIAHHELVSLYPGSRRKNPGEIACLSPKPSAGNGRFRVAVLILAWLQGMEAPEEQIAAMIGEVKDDGKVSMDFDEFVT